MAKPTVIEFPDGKVIPIVYEDRSILVLDKPAGWLIAPDDWYNTRRNFTLALRSSLENGDWWAKSRSLKFLQIIHRLDAETSGLLMCVKSPGAVNAYSALFEERRMKKVYYAVVEGPVPDDRWVRSDMLGPAVGRVGVFRVVREGGREAETEFRVLSREAGYTLVEASPASGRTHQIRLHLLASGCPVVGDELYGRSHPEGLALRAVELGFLDPFTKKPVRILAQTKEFLLQFGVRMKKVDAGSTPPMKD
jgi:RluA family pseudouridine synthase